jgi:hypothetical protein
MSDGAKFCGASCQSFWLSSGAAKREREKSLPGAEVVGSRDLALEAVELAAWAMGSTCSVGARTESTKPDAVRGLSDAADVTQHC